MVWSVVGLISRQIINQICFILENNDILLSGFMNNIRGDNDILSNPYITLSAAELNPMKQLIDEFEP